MKNLDPNRDRDPDPDHDNDNDNDNGHAVAAVPTGGALTSLEALGAMLAKVDTSSVAGHSGLPMLQFKREGDGCWSYGQKRTIVESGSCWAVNPTTFRRGFICFNDSKKVIGERLVSVAQAKPNVAELPDTGFEWQEQWAVNLKCLDGTDAGVEVIYKPTTGGGLQAVSGLIETIRDRISGGAHGGKVAPIVHLEKDFYVHSKHGKVWTPLLTLVDWMPLEGPAPTSAPAPTTPPPIDQPRRRRVG
jgi:hypothetical protein